MSCYIVQETDGTSRFTLEDGSGFLILEDCAAVPPGPGVGGPPIRGSRRRRREQIGDEEAVISLVLSVLD